MLKIRFFLIPVLIVLFLPTGKLNAQPPVNDRCIKAQPVQLGELLMGISNEYATVGPAAETPAGVPATCIQTFENDLWYRFKTVEEYDLYQIVIGHGACNTPAGLQALVIQSPTCNQSDFEYLGCSNKENTDTVKIFLEEATPGKELLIYIDGFDGTICEFSLEVRGMKREELTMRQIRYVRYDYDQEKEPVFDPEYLDRKFLNNELILEWSARAEDQAAFFMVEIYPEFKDGEKKTNYAKVIGIVDAANKVIGGTTQYRFVDFSTRFKNQDYCYRIVAVDHKGRKQYSKDIIMDLDPVTEFYVSPVQPSKTHPVALVSYINYKKKSDYLCELMDDQGKVLKSFVLKKEPVRDGQVTIRMEEYPTGRYVFKMSNGEDFFLREFFYEAK